MDRPSIHIPVQPNYDYVERHLEYRLRPEWKRARSQAWRT